MTQNSYNMHRQFLYFLEPSAEDHYRAYTRERVLKFTRATWGIVILLAVIFSVLDHRFFGENALLVGILRFCVILLALVMVYCSGRPKQRWFIDWNAFIFVFFLGLFCNILTLLDVTAGFSLWFASLFFVYPGLFITAGIGFRYSFFAMITTPVVFNLFYLLGRPFHADEFLFYNIFLSGMLVIYIFLAYLVEYIFRKNYVTMDRLTHSLEQVRQLSGLLPICSKCKKIRDDRGYWQQVETYIEHHSQATFSHGLCPACLEIIYGDKKWYQKMKDANPSRSAKPLE